MVIPEWVRQPADPFRDVVEAGSQNPNLRPAPDQFGQRTETSVRMIAWPRHTELPEVLIKHEVCELTPELPPILPEMSPVVSIDGLGLVDSPVLQKPRDSKQENFGCRTFCGEQLKLNSLSQYKERNLVKLVAESNSEGLE